MPSRQQKSAKKVSERNLMFGPNHILVTLRWDDGRKKKKKKKKKSKSVKSLRYMDDFFPRLITSHYLEVAGYI